MVSRAGLPAAPRCPRRLALQWGFTYIGLLLLLALLGSVLAAAGTLWHTELQRDREQELLFAGEEIRRAIQTYREETPAGEPARFPARIEDLLDDRRWPTVRRHLRRAYIDPMTGSREWGTVAAPGGGIMCVHSTSDAAPLKRAGFPRRYDGFAQATAYVDWRFCYGALTLSPAAGPSENAAAIRADPE
ncbi:type II secretion system protein [Aquincola sp. MAHUQ-54]|uniref:Type II secretion system protein n=1 Tax=Aquincola agrisoli TaxID=3119538 RepID=A0AAW9Q8B9_9BURK